MSTPHEATANIIQTIQELISNTTQSVISQLQQETTSTDSGLVQSKIPQVKISILQYLQIISYI